ncbi:MAG TPA: MFS transporter [Streptosporangiaceae bacterium]|nr:MFS transporter [Streptosporangiaceae bacterium]
MTVDGGAPADADRAAAPGDGGRQGRRRRLAMVVISLGVSLIVVDATIVNVLLPQIIGELRLHATDAEWITSIYSLTFAALLITCGRIADLIGRRRMFVIGTLVFVAASMAAAAAGTGPELITARLVQGAGASMIMPATLSTVNAVFTGRDRAVAFGIWGSLIAGMAAVGPLLGGWLATSYGWRWAFAVNLPLGAAIVAGAMAFVPETRETSGADDGERGRGRDGGRGHGGGGLLARLDLTGCALSGAGFGAIVFALIEGQRYGWWRAVSPFTAGPLRLSGLSPVPIAALGGAGAIAALIVVERARARAGRPVVLDPTLLRIPSFRIGSAAGALVSVGELGLLFALPLFLQNVHGSSPLATCAAILPLALGALCTGPNAARLSRAYGPARVVQLGLLIEVAAVLAIALTTRASADGWSFAPWMLLYGVGLGLTSAQLTDVTLRAVPLARSGLAAGTNTTARQLGAAVGIALIGAVFTTSLGQAMAARTHDPTLARELRASAGTYARALREPAARPTPDPAAPAGAAPVAPSGAAPPAAAAPPPAGPAGAPSSGTEPTSRDAPPVRADPYVVRAADESLAVATRRAALTTAGILALGLLMTLRLADTAVRNPAESATMNVSSRPGR